MTERKKKKTKVWANFLVSTEFAISGSWCDKVPSTKTAIPLASIKGIAIHGLCDTMSTRSHISDITLELHVCVAWKHYFKYYRPISNIRHSKSQHLNVSHLVFQLPLPNPLMPGVEIENEDVVGAAPTGDAPSTSEWSTILFPNKVHLILDVWLYIKIFLSKCSPEITYFHCKSYFFYS